MVLRLTMPLMGSDMVISWYANKWTEYCIEIWLDKVSYDLYAVYCYQARPTAGHKGIALLGKMSARDSGEVKEYVHRAIDAQSLCVKE